MKAITLWQPYASAIPLGLKSYETRSWKTKLRGPILIHAAKRAKTADREFCKTMAALYGRPELADPPLGAIVAKADIVDIFNVEDIRDTLSTTELAFGDYDDGRFAWKLENIQPLIEPIPYRGGQGLFTVSDQEIAAARFSKPLNNMTIAS
ncbi:MAG: hypothetical protein CL472_06530 [Acidobacteria bacterium]|nr:hypothetical protein [Acidobacteriota bacterium]